MTLGWEEGIPHPWMSTGPPEGKLQPPWPKQKRNVWIIRAPFSSPGSLSFKVEFMKKASWTGRTTGKQGVDLCAAVQAHTLSRIYQKTEKYPQEAGGYPLPPANTDTQPRCSIHRNHLRTSERVRLELQIKEETLKTKQKCI